MPDTSVDTANAALQLGSEMGIACAAALRDTLADAVAGLPDMAGGLQLDLGAVQDFDSSGVQLLLSARRSLAARGQVLQVVAASAPVRDALLLFGLGELLAAAPA